MSLCVSHIHPFIYKKLLTSSEGITVFISVSPPVGKKW